MRWAIALVATVALGWGLSRDPRRAAAAPAPAALAELRATVLPVPGEPGWTTVAGVVRAVRGGEVPPPALWTRPGLAGLAALEARRAGRVDLDPAIRAMAASPPTPMDALAARWVLPGHR